MNVKVEKLDTAMDAGELDALSTLGMSVSWEFGVCEASESTRGRKSLMVSERQACILSWNLSSNYSDLTLHEFHPKR